MRLLYYDEQNKLDIKSFDDRALPRYAILSHTWGPDTEEVTFADIKAYDGEAKHGYKKLTFCGQQAQRDGLQYFWVDTCCIDKTDNSELSHAIQSMFRWYQNATRCYVYLSDVPEKEEKIINVLDQSTWETDFRASRWFTRGWTLQELLAPSIVEFFSKNEEKLGDKVTLKSLIQKITGISHSALDGTPLSCFSVDDRLRWKGHRQTKREEDGWYSLQGILDVEIAPAYSEGAASAFRRLMEKRDEVERCTRDLCHTDPKLDKKRIEKTKDGLLAESYRWVFDNTTFQHWQQDVHSQLLWVKGDPGKGKTMLLCGIIDELTQLLSKNDLLAYFFCQATDSRINSALAVLRSLLYMLVSQQPSLVLPFLDKYNRVGRGLFEDANAWFAVTEIFEDLLRNPQLRSTCLIIDALDECVTELPKLLQFIAKQSSASSRVKWIVSSRNWPEIEERLEQAGHKIRLSLELNGESVSAAVGKFIQHNVTELAKQKRYDQQMQDMVLGRLTRNADGTFLWAALVCQELRATNRWNVLKKLDDLPRGLTQLYKQMLLQISVSDDTILCKQVLAVVALVYRPITLQELVALTESLEGIVDEYDVRGIIGCCRSFLTLREDTIHFVHQSAKDFLLKDAFYEIFPQGVEVTHRMILSRSLVVLSDTLLRDMYDLKEPGIAIEDVRQPESDPFAASRYSCVYWVDHLQESLSGFRTSNVEELEVVRRTESFIKTKYLYWLEGLSLCRSIGRGVLSVAKLHSLAQVWHGKVKGVDNELAEVSQDASRFIMYHKGVIESYPLQIYASALMFSPIKSAIRRLFAHEVRTDVTVISAMSSSWSACLQTLEGHSKRVTSVHFSHDSVQLASGSWDNSIKVWSVSSGECLQTLNRHSEEVLSVAFSHNSTRLVSGSNDYTIKVWDASTGECLQTLEEHKKSVSSVVFSHDSALLGSGSDDCTIKVWDTSSGECLQTFKGHNKRVTSVAFSHDSTSVASGSDDRTVKMWDTRNGECLQTLKGHNKRVTSVAFSHDSTRLASGSDDHTVKLWIVSSGQCLQTFDGHSSRVSSVAFSHDSTRIASGRNGNVIKVTDVSRDKGLQTLLGHSKDVYSVAFSHDSTRLASGSLDNTVKVWDTSSNTESLQTLKDHSNHVNSIVFSHNFTWLASASWDRTVKMWDASTGECLRTLVGHRENVSSIAFSRNSNQIASGSYDNTVKVWDLSSGECLQTLGAYGHWVYSVVFSHDSSRLASGSLDKTIKVWDLSCGECLQTLEGHEDYVGSVVFSQDSSWVASGSDDCTIKVWDTSSGECLQTLKGHNKRVTSVAFSHDSTRLASGSDDHTVKLWNVSNGECMQNFNVGRRLTQLSFDASGSSIHTEIGTINITASQSSQAKATEAHPVLCLGPTISLDNKWIKHLGKNLIRIPSEYRPWCWAVRMRTIVMGVGSGRVWMCTINE